jgi:hypothetical protein
MRIPSVSVQVQNNSGNSTPVQNSPSQSSTPTKIPNEDKKNLDMQQTNETGIFEMKPTLFTKLILVGYGNGDSKVTQEFESCKLHQLGSKIKSNLGKEIRLVLNPTLKNDFKFNPTLKEDFLKNIKGKISILDTRFYDQMDFWFQSFYPNYFSLANDFKGFKEYKNVKSKKIFPILESDELFEVEKKTAISETFMSKIQDKLKDGNYSLQGLNLFYNEKLLKDHLEFFNKIRETIIESHDDKIIRFSKPVFCYCPTNKMGEDLFKIFELGAQECVFGMDSNGKGFYVTTFLENAINLMMENNEEFQMKMEKRKEFKLIAGYCIPGEFEKIVDGDTRKGLQPEKNSNFVRMNQKNEPVEDKDDQHFDWLVLKEKRQFYPCFEVILSKE